MIVATTGNVIADKVKPYKDKFLIALETAADFVCISNGSLYINEIVVYAEHKIECDSVFRIVVLPNCFDMKRYIESNGVYCTTIEQTILDLLENEGDTDIQVLVESLSNYYYKHNETFGKLGSLMYERQTIAFNKWKEDAIDYYNDN